MKIPEHISRVADLLRIFFTILLTHSPAFIFGCLFKTQFISLINSR
jgi:hypothetical protein